MPWLWLAKTIALVGAELIGEGVTDLLLDEVKPRPARLPRPAPETTQARLARGSRYQRKR